MPTTFRPGAIGAMLDEYEKAIAELKEVIGSISDSALTVIIDPQTPDDNCRSIQAILSHVVSAGYGYATSIHNLKEHNRERPARIFRTTIKDYLDDLTAVFAFTEDVFREFSDAETEQLDDSLKIKAGWGQLYDIEQMMEHAIVHILRHRRQIEKIKLLMKRTFHEPQV